MCKYNNNNPLQAFSKNPTEPFFTGGGGGGVVY